jgi:hypothetical protein
LARQLERAEAMANAAFVDARRDSSPHVGADWIEIAGAYAMFDGVASPITQSFGLGIFEPFADSEFAAIEQFFTAHGAPTAHEVCSFAARDALSLLSSRGYHPIESSVVLVQPITSTSSDASRVAVHRVRQGEEELYARIAVQGWSQEAPELAQFIEEFGALATRAKGSHCFIAALDAEPIAAGALNLQNGVALFAGACTIPGARRQGAQRALLHARLTFAAQLGTSLAMVVTAPGSASYRNAERQGFRPVYTRAKWLRPIGGAR